MISISIVSHMQMNLVINLLDDIERVCKLEKIEVILTLNVGESLDLLKYSFPLSVIKNNRPKGFGENHNQAFKSAKGSFFCVMNPDIRLTDNPFLPLVRCLTEGVDVGVVAPVILNDSGLIEDSARLFPSPVSIFSKVISKLFRKSALSRPVSNKSYEWIGGMFMLFKVDTYSMVNGFDERYFMYYEDVDICARLTSMGKLIVLCEESSAIHLAQRASHRSLRHLRWHIISMLRFFLSSAYWRVLWR
ncbi:hypothetical protein B9Z36_10875 [Limnohabitans sp. Rim8]|nr:hypothetical protein B9Z36_10875 [Limnohabitans sp. Rim8]